MHNKPKALNFQINKQTGKIRKIKIKQKNYKIKIFLNMLNKKIPLHSLNLPRVNKIKFDKQRKPTTILCVN